MSSAPAPAPAGPNRPDGPVGPRPRRRLGPGLTAFLVVDVVLVVVLVVLAATALSDRGGSGTAASPSPTPSATAQVEETPDATAPADAEDAQELAAFVLPSGNIWCEMTAEAATCTILNAAYDPPEPRDDCDAEIGQVLRVTAEGETGFPCREPERPPEGTPELTYGEASTVGELSCFSSRNGAHCRHNPTGVGFSVARAGYTQFD